MAYEYITNRDSPNYWGPGTVLARYGMPRTIIGITYHHWDDPAKRPQFWGTVNWVCRDNGNTSAHEVIEAGRVACLINHSNAGWHSGHAKGNAQTIGLELNPRASEADYDTAAERIADIRHMHGEDFPLFPHRYWTQTACPGRYDGAKLDRLARAWTKRKYGSGAGLASDTINPIKKDWFDMASENDLRKIIQEEIRQEVPRIVQKELGQHVGELVWNDHKLNNRVSGNASNPARHLEYTHERLFNIEQALIARWPDYAATNAAYQAEIAAQQEGK